MAQDQLPDWAVVGAEVWLEPHTYGRYSTYKKATITRVTKTSVFIKQDGSDHERRFVNTRWNVYGATERRMEEYGTRSDHWSHPAYLHAGKSDIVAQGLAANLAMTAYNEANTVLREFTTQNPTIDRKEAAERGIVALTAYLDALKVL